MKKIVSTYGFWYFLWNKFGHDSNNLWQTFKLLIWKRFFLLLFFFVSVTCFSKLADSKWSLHSVYYRFIKYNPTEAHTFRLRKYAATQHKCTYLLSVTLIYVHKIIFKVKTSNSYSYENLKMYDIIKKCI